LYCCGGATGPHTLHASIWIYTRSTPPFLTFRAPALGDQDSHGGQHHDAEEGGVREELDEVFEGCFGHDAADPGAEMIHLEHATVDFATMMGAVRFMGERVDRFCEEDSHNLELRR
jgi:hypothetical protein